MIPIDYRLLSAAALDGLLSETLLRQGTDYFEMEMPFNDRKQRLLNQLEKGRAQIAYDPKTDQCDILFEGISK